jgi:two-component system, cell cycle response regulator
VSSRAAEGTDEHNAVDVPGNAIANGETTHEQTLSDEVARVIRATIGRQDALVQTHEQSDRSIPGAQHSVGPMALVSSLPAPSGPSVTGQATIAPPEMNHRTSPHLHLSDTIRKRALITVLAGVNAGQVFSLDRREMVVGRGVEADIWIEDPGVSRRHALIRRVEDQYIIVDLGSTNGTFVNDSPARSTVLSPGDRIQIGTNLVVTFAMVDDAEEELRRRLYEASTRDGLTLAFNRSAFMDRLVHEMASAKRTGGTLAVLLLDLDHFKKLNDTHGHLAGDIMLRATADAIGKLLRVEDLLARYGGEEFVVVAKGLKAKDGNVLAEKIRRAIQELRPMAGKPVHATLSVGVATLAELGDSTQPEDLIQLADRRLYEAKNSGRNKVTPAPES